LHAAAFKSSSEILEHKNIFIGVTQPADRIARGFDPNVTGKIIPRRLVIVIFLFCQIGEVVPPSTHAPNQTLHSQTHRAMPTAIAAEMA
jgi:hypothetical protein